MRKPGTARESAKPGAVLHRQRCFFLHTLNGRPARFDGEQIVYADDAGHDPGGVAVARSAAQIVREQKAAAAFRTSRGLDLSGTYGSVALRLPRARS